MIKKINIQKFGLFNSYQWDKQIGGDVTFSRLNIIYGRNYSGKTTLSRIFRCLELKEKHPNYADCDYSLTLGDGKVITPNNFGELSANVRVYNSDFVKDNLSWLHDDEGMIKPFTILGAKNVELDAKIKAIEDGLGSVQEKKGLLYELEKQGKEFELKSKELRHLINDLEAKLKKEANDKIKIDHNFFMPSSTKKTYQIGDIKAEMLEILPDIDVHILKVSDSDEKLSLLKEEPLPNITPLTAKKPNFIRFYRTVDDLLSRKIIPSETISDLINNSLLQEWVRSGIELHQEKRNICGFCGGELPKDLWKKLGAHFSKESEVLRSEINIQIQQLTDAKESLKGFLFLRRSEFYNVYRKELEELLGEWETLSKQYTQNIEALIQQLKLRLKDIFRERAIENVPDISDDILKSIENLNILIEKNNRKTLSLATEQNEARKQLRYSRIAEFIKVIDYQKKQEMISVLEEELVETGNKYQGLKTKIEFELEAKRRYEAEANDESKGAELVNEHLAQFFGHDELKLVAEGESPNMKFKITRENEQAQNLSEGECSLISFCYFIAKMEDEMKDSTNISKLVIYIDDPISSLDSNHVFFIYSLIETILTKGKNYGQLFISTHNLDFLKYLKRLTVPDGRESLTHYLIERKHKTTDKRTFLVLMPPHLREYVTEFNYLFNEIYNVYKQVSGDKKMKLINSYNQFYNLPNNLRKFLECYLFYRYPNNQNPLDNLEKLFDNNIPSLISRVINEYSHLTFIDRGWKPIDVDEAEECAKLVLEKIKEKDPEQFAALLESINCRAQELTAS